MIIHLQPLPLFRLEDLQKYLTTAPRFLLWSFLALTLTFSNHEFYGGRVSEAIEFYTQSAHDTVIKLAAEGVTRLEVTQSMCLLALRYVEGECGGISLYI